MLRFVAVPIDEVLLYTIQGMDPWRVILAVPL